MISIILTSLVISENLRVKKKTIKQKLKKSVFLSYCFTDEEILNNENEVGMAKLNLFNKQSSSFKASYRSTGTSLKQVNKLFAYVDINSSDPGQVKAEIKSANFEVGDYPMNAKHT